MGDDAGGGGSGAGFSPWTNMAPQSPAPSTTGTKRDFGNMLNEKIGKPKKIRKQETHWELPKKMKLGF